MLFTKGDYTYYGSKGEYLSEGLFDLTKYKNASMVVCDGETIKDVEIPSIGEEFLIKTLCSCTGCPE